MINRLRKRL